jgi:hypothetical protein
VAGVVQGSIMPSRPKKKLRLKCNEVKKKKKKNRVKRGLFNNIIGR